MAVSKCGTSRCGLCQFYVHEGRRGGLCSQLDVPVQSQWKACCLAVSPFEATLETPNPPTVGIAEWSSSPLSIAKPTLTAVEPIKTPVRLTKVI